MDIETVYVIDYEILRGRQNEEVVKEVSFAAENVIETFHFKSPCIMIAHGCDKNGLSWGDGQLDYDNLRETINEAIWIRASVRVWHSKDQISHRIAGAACTKSGGF